MTRAREVFRASLGIDRSQDGLRTIVRRDSGRYTPSSCIDRDSKRCAEVRGVVEHHWSQFQLVKPLAGHCEAHQTPREGSHKIDHFRSDHLCRDHEVTFILTMLIIGMTIMRPDRNSLSDFSISANFTAWATGQRSSPPDTRETSDETSRSTALG